MSTAWLRELRAAATPGPWGVYEYSDDSLYIETVGETGSDREYVLELRPNRGTKDADLDLILLAPDLAEIAADMAEALEALHAEVEMAESVGICLPDRVPSLRAGDLLVRLAVLAERTRSGSR